MPAVAFQEDAVGSSAKPIKTTEVKKIESVAGGKFYRVTFQIGPNKSFGKCFPSQKWSEIKSVTGGESTYDPVYKVFEQILDSDCTNGLIQENNDWHAANLRQRVEGEIGRMIVVLDVKELKDYCPPDMTFLQGGMPMQVFKMIVDAAVDSRLKSSK